MSDVVSGLLTKLDELEQLAEAASKTGLAFMWARQNGRSTMKRWLSEVADPDHVLRLCRAHRDLIELHARIWIHPNHPDFNDAHLTKEPMPICRSCQPEGMWRRAESWPCRTLKAIAEAYGLEAEFEAAKEQAKRLADILHGRARGLGVEEQSSE